MVELNPLTINILIITGAFIITRLARWTINKTFLVASKKINADLTGYKFLKNAVSTVIWLIAIGAVISSIPQLKALTTTMFAGAGILVAIVGFASQQAFSNIISGIFIVLFKPFRVGDMIKVGNFEAGIVEDITLRHTIIKDFRNKRIIIPNSTIGSEVIVNDSIHDKKICKWIEVGISYDSDVDTAIRILQEESIKHPSCIDTRTEEQKEEGMPLVKVRLISFGESSVNLRAYIWTNDPEIGFQMHSDINMAVKKRFDKEGIEIPFPHRTIVYKNDLINKVNKIGDEKEV